MITRQMIKNWDDHINKILPRLTDWQKAQVRAYIIERYIEGWDFAEWLDNNLREARNNLDTE